jgi:hypothetical protein
VFELDLPIQLWLYVIEDTLGGNNPEGSLKGLLDRLLSWFGTTLNHRKNLIAHPITPTDPGFIVGYKNLLLPLLPSLPELSPSNLLRQFF